MTSPAARHFDLCVIGCGPAGFAGATRALDLGKQVCLVEESEIGGAGVKWGALASKTLWELAKDFGVAAKSDRGYRCAALEVDYRALRETVLTAVAERQQQMRHQLAVLAPETWAGPGSIDYRQGRARLLSGGLIGIAPAGGGPEQQLNADFVLVASGSRPRALAGLPVDGRRVFDSDTILQLTAFPGRLLILGAGIIGCEYASIFSAFGRSEVLLVDSAARVIPFEDEDVSHFVSSRLQASGVKIIQAALLREACVYDEAVEVVLEQAGGATRREVVDAVLVAVGRTPNTAGLGLERVGITPAAGYVMPSDENCRVSGTVYAAGDVNRHPALVNIAETEARYAVKHMYGVTRFPLRYRNICTVMFFRPAVAAVGLSERSCREQGIAHRVAVYANALLSRAIAMRASDGFVKIVVSDDAEQRILGMRAAGPQVSSTIVAIGLLMDQKRGLRDVLKSVHPHPTLSEGIQECLRLLEGKSIFKPAAFPQWLQIRSWSPEHGARAVC